MSSRRPSLKLHSSTKSILRQYRSLVKHQGATGVDLLEDSDPWKLASICYFIEMADDDATMITRARVKPHWSLFSWGNPRFEVWYVLKCDSTDPLVRQWRLLQSAFREARFGVVPALRIRDGDVYYAFIENVSYPKDWILDRECLSQVCSDFQSAVDERMEAQMSKVAST